jgi:hypothetical protein
MILRSHDLVESLESRRLFAFPIIAGTAGTTGTIDVTAIATDHNGSVIAVGSYTGTIDFNPAGGAARASRGGADAFAALYASDGTFRWVRTWGGTGDEGADAVTIDPTNRQIVLAGHYTTRFNFPIGTALQRVGVAGIRDMFVGTFTSNGHGVSLQQFGQTGSVFVNDIEVGAGGAIGVVGSFNGAIDVDPTSAGVRIEESPTGREAGFAILLSARRRFGWYVSSEADSDQVRFNDAAFDPPTGGLVVVGETNGNYETITTEGRFVMNTGDKPAAIALKLSGAGKLTWGKNLIGSDLTTARGVITDRKGSVFIVGQYMGIVDLDPGTVTRNVTQGSTSTGATFVSKLSAAGAYVWGDALIANGFVLGEAISFNSAGNIAVVGAFSGTGDFDPGAGTRELTAREFVASDGTRSPGVDVFVAEYTAFGGAVLNAQRTGGSVREFATTITYASGLLYTDFEPVTGSTRTLVLRWLSAT